MTSQNVMSANLRNSLARAFADANPQMDFRSAALVLVVCILAIVACVAVAPASTSYLVEGLGIPNGAIRSAALGINSNNQVAGYADVGSSTEGLLFAGGGYTVIPSLSGGSAQAMAIDDNGQMAGNGQVSGGNNNAFLYSGGNTVALGSLSGPLGTPVSYGYGIDAAGDVVGTSGTNANLYHAFFYSASSQAMTDLGTLGGSSSDAFGISANGKFVVGDASTVSNQTHAYIYSVSGQSMADLGTLGGSTSSAQAVNNAGHVAGYSTTTGEADTDAFFYDGTTIHDLGDPDGFGAMDKPSMIPI